MDIKKRIMGKIESVVERVELIEEHLWEEILRDRILRKVIYKILCGAMGKRGHGIKVTGKFLRNEREFKDSEEMESERSVII